VCVASFYQNLSYGPHQSSSARQASNTTSPFSLPTSTEALRYQTPRGHLNPLFLGPYHTLPITNTLPSSSYTPLFFPPFFTPNITLPNSTGALPLRYQTPRRPLQRFAHHQHNPLFLLHTPIFPPFFTPKITLPNSTGLLPLPLQRSAHHQHTPLILLNITLFSHLFRQFFIFPSSGWNQRA
jgi:hypothetical protein